jgi:hypothetical protein
MNNQGHLTWRKFGLFSCGISPKGPNLNFEVLWTPVLKARLESHSWLDDSGWQTFIETAEIGDVFNGFGTIIVVRLRELQDDYETDDWNSLRKEES